MYRLNLSKSARDFHAAEAIVVSVPKSGRTWLRVMVQHYYCTRARVPFRLYARGDASIGIPYIEYTHDLWRHRMARGFGQRIKGKFLIPAKCNDKPILLLTRDLRDVLVSLYFELTKRQDKFSGSLSKLVTDRTYGAEATVDILNQWWREWNGSDLFLHTTYEKFKGAPEKELARVLAHIGDSDPDHGAIAKAVEFSSFENMRRREEKESTDDIRLKPGDPRDPESFKVRRGVVGGYVDYLNERDLAVIENALSRLELPAGN